jgi:type IV pilus assembly protein PilE
LSSLPVRSNRPQGFTLMELVVTMLIVAILAAFAIPAYTAFLVRGKRAEAKVALLQAAQYMERNYTQAGSYNIDAATGAALTVLPPSLARAPAAGAGAANYNLTVASAAQSFLLSATPVFADPECGVLTLDNTGLQGVAPAATLPAAECWRR